MLRCFIIMGLFQCLFATPASYTNPVVSSNTPDPGVLEIDDGYIAVTSSGFSITTDVFPIRYSKNLADWSVVGSVFPGSSHPEWAAPPFYAPEVHVSRTTNSSVYWLVYDATEQATGLMAVGAAWSLTPTGPFKDLGAPLMRGVGGGSASAIDATMWQTDDGHLYLGFKNKHGSSRHIMLQELKLTSDHLNWVLSTVSKPEIILEATELWEAQDVEGPFFWRGKSGWMYLFYSGSNTWGSSYAIGVARAKEIIGPWEKMGLPIAHTRAGSNTTNTTFVSPGHNSVVAVQNSTYLIYHSNMWGQVGVDCIRHMMVDRLVWGSDGWPQLATPDGAPSDRPVPVP